MKVDPTQVFYVTFVTSDAVARIGTRTQLMRIGHNSHVERPAAESRPRLRRLNETNARKLVLGRMASQNEVRLSDLQPTFQERKER